MINKEKTRSLKQSNRFVILNALRKEDDVSIAKLAKSVDLSKPTIKKVIDHYIAKGFIKEVGKGKSTEEGGKRPILYRFNEDYACIISLHLGPDFVNTAVLNFRGEITESEYVPLESDISFAEVLDILVGQIEKFKSLRRSQGIAIDSLVLSLPGIVDPEAGVLRYSPHFEAWGSDLEFKAEIINRTGSQLPIYVDNVNRYQAFVEMLEGKAVGIKNFVCIDALEEGVGSGIITGGKISHGSQNIAGEIGHCVVNTHDGCECICGGKGCFEAEVSWKNICRLIAKGKENFPDSVLSQVEELSLETLFTSVRASDPLAVDIMDKVTTSFARGINNVIVVKDPELIIIQGIYNELGDVFLNTIKKKVDEMSLLSMRRDIKLCFSDFGLDRGVRGAGLYSISNFFEQDHLYSN